MDLSSSILGTWPSSAEEEPQSEGEGSSGVLSSLGGGSTAAAAGCAHALQSFFDRFDFRFGSISTLSEVCQIETPGTINAVSLSADGKVAAAGGSGKEVIVLSTFSDSNDSREGAAAFGIRLDASSDHSDGQGTTSSASSSSSSSEKASKCQVVQRFRVGDLVFGVCLNGTGSRVAVGGADKTALLFDVKTGCELFEALSFDRIRCVALSSRAQVLGFGGFDQRVQLCNTQRGTALQSLPSSDVVHGVSVSADGQRLAMGGDDQRVTVLDMRSKDCLRSWLHPKKVWAVALSGSGEVVCSGDYDSTVIARHVASGDTLLRYKFAARNGPAFVWSVTLNHDASMLVAGSWNGEVRLWRARTKAANGGANKEDGEEEADDAGTQSGGYVELTPTSEHRGRGASNKPPLGHPASPPALLARPDRVFSLALARRGRVLAVGDRAGVASVYCLSPSPTDLSRGARRGSAGGGSLSGGAGDGGSRSSAAESPAVSVQLEVQYPNRVFSVALSEDGTLFALGGVHKQAWLYSTLTKQRLRVFTSSSVLRCVAFTALPSPQDRPEDGAGSGQGAGSSQSQRYALAMGGEDRVVSVWECGCDSSGDDDDGVVVNDGALPVSSSEPERAPSAEVVGAGSGAESGLEALLAGPRKGGASARVPTSFQRLFHMVTQRDVNAIAFSADALCVASGCKVACVGGFGEAQWSWRDRPDFEAMAGLLSEGGDKESLSTVLSRFPTAVNLCHPHTGEALMQRAVRLHTDDVLDTILGVAGAGVGFVQDKAHRTALLTALLHEKRGATARLLGAVSSGRVSSMPSSLNLVTECFPLLSKVFPSLLLDLICKMPLVKEPEILSFNSSKDKNGSQATFARLKDGDMLVRGSDQQAGPQWLWKNVCDDASSVEGGEGAEAHAIARDPQTNGGDGEDFRHPGGHLFRGSKASLSDPPRPASPISRTNRPVGASRKLDRADSSVLDGQTVAVFDTSKGVWRAVKQKVPKAYRLYVALNSSTWVVIVLALVVCQVSLELAFGSNSSVLTLNYIISFIFFVEILLRLYCTWVLQKTVWKFFSDIYNVVDFFVVALDVVVFALAFLRALTNDSSGNSSTATLARSARVMKFFRTNRLTRLFRLFKALRVTVVLQCFGADSPLLGVDKELAHAHQAVLRDLLRDRSQRAEVSAFRVPFENFAGFYDDLDEAPLHLITNAAHKLQRLEVFDSLIMRATIDFKWKQFARNLFYAQFLFFLSFLLAVVSFGILASRTAKSTSGGGGGGEYADEIEDDDEDVFPTLLSLSGSSAGRAAIVISPFMVFSCILFLVNELQQLISIGAGAYFVDIWNYLDLAGFGLEMVAVGAWLLRANAHIIRALLSLSTLLLLVKTLYFARGFTKWGPLVRMLVTITEDMLPFMLIVIVFVSGFGIAFAIYNEDAEGSDSWNVFDSINFVLAMAVFGDKIGYLPEDVGGLPLPDLAVNNVFYISVMLIVNIILLNLLIAIMADSYARVQKWEELEALHERSTIIMEMEQSMLPVSTALTKGYHLAKNGWWRAASSARYLLCCCCHSSLYRAKNDPVATSARSVPWRDSWKEPIRAQQAAHFPVWLHLLKAGTEDGRATTESAGSSAETAGARSRGKGTAGPSAGKSDSSAEAIVSGVVRRLKLEGVVLSQKAPPL